MTEVAWTFDDEEGWWVAPCLSMAVERARAMASDECRDRITVCEVSRPTHHEAMRLVEGAVPPALCKDLEERLAEAVDWLISDDLIGHSLELAIGSALAALLAPTLRQRLFIPLEATRQVVLLEPVEAEA